MHWYILLIVGLAILAFMIFFFKQNRKDKKDLVDKLNQDYHKSKNEEGDIDTEEMPH